MSSFFTDLTDSVDPTYVDNVLYSLIITVGYLTLRKFMKYMNNFKPLAQSYRRNDTSLAKPFIDLPSYDPMILRFSYDVPLVIFVLTYIIDDESLHKGAKFVVCFFASMTFRFLVKYVIARPRPHFLTVNHIDFDPTDTKVYDYVPNYSNDETCYYIKKSTMSFFSGHAMYGTIAGVYISLHVVELFGFNWLTKLIAAFLMYFGSYPAIVQYRLNWHFLSDLVVGYLIGFLSATFFFYYVRL